MANSRKREEKRRSARMRTKAKHVAIEPEDVDEEDGNVVEENSDDAESLRKDYGYAEISPMPGPVSWEENDAIEVAREKAERAQEVMWTARALVSNILWADMTPDQKGKAIKAVGDGISKKISEVESEHVSKELDLELIETESILAKDLRLLSISEKASDWITKKKLTASAENKLSDDQFALVADEDGKKVRKYPIHDKAHVRNALARAAQMIKQGGQAEADARAALPKIHAAAKKMGIGVSEKSVSDIMIEKDASGKWRAVMWPSNNFKDLDGEIISEKAHQEYVDWVNDNMDCSPAFITWHRGGTRREARVDFVAYEDGFLIMSAPLTEKEAGGLLKAQTMTQLGMSHGSFVLERDADNPNIITKYRMVEVSDLPLEKAANPFTNLETLMKEADMPKVDTKEYLAAILGSEDEAEKYLSRAGLKQKELIEAGVEHKEVSAESKTEPAPAAPVDMDSLVQQVFDRVAKELDVDGLNEYLVELKEKADKVTILEGVIKDMAQSREEKLVEMLTPPASKSLVWQKARASASSDTVLDPENNQDKQLKKSQPELGWLSQVTGTQPVNS